MHSKRSATFRSLHPHRQFTWEQTRSFCHERMLEGARVGVEHGGAQAQLPPDPAPSENRRENLAQNFLRLGRLQTEAFGGGERDGDRRLFLLLGNGRLVHAHSVHFRHGIEIVSRRQRPVAGMEYQEADCADDRLDCWPAPKTPCPSATAILASAGVRHPPVASSRRSQATCSPPESVSSKPHGDRHAALSTPQLERNFTPAARAL
jgi:hypothetical protein